MSLYDSHLEKISIRAALLSFSRKKLLLSFAVLFLSHFLSILFFLAVEEGSSWAKMEFSLFPYFIFLSFLPILSILLIRLHHHEAKNKELSLKHLYQSSLELWQVAFCLFLLPLALYLLIWMTTSLFFLLSQVPWIGVFFTLFFSWIPFFFWLVGFIFLVVKPFFLFLASPLIALQKANLKSSFGKVVFWIQNMPLKLFAYFLIAIFPFLFVSFFLYQAFLVTEMGFCFQEGIVIQYLFYSILSSAFLSPFLNFFFGFAAEAAQLFLRAEEER